MVFFCLHSLLCSLMLVTSGKTKDVFIYKVHVDNFKTFFWYVIRFHCRSFGIQNSRLIHMLILIINVNFFDFVNPSKLSTISDARNSLHAHHTTLSGNNKNFAKYGKSKIFFYCLNIF